jgi:hypothetical protein
VPGLHAFITQRARHPVARPSRPPSKIIGRAIP